MKLLNDEQYRTAKDNVKKIREMLNRTQQEKNKGDVIKKTEQDKEIMLELQSQIDEYETATNRA